MGKPVFISYRSSDGQELAEKLQIKLEDSGIDAYLDKSDLRPGEWPAELQAAIKDCQVFVPVITDGYIERLKSSEEQVIWKEVTHALQCHGPTGVIPYYADSDIENKCEETTFKIAGEFKSLNVLKGSRADMDEIIRLISDVCPNARLTAIEEKSEKYIDAWKNARKLLYDEAMVIQRRLKVDGSEIKCDTQNIFELIKMHKEICISGDGGCGKSFLLQQIFSVFRQSASHIAIYVKLSEVNFDAKDGNPIIDYVQNHYAAKDVSVFQELNKNRNPQVIFLLDGLNEVEGDQSQAKRKILALSEISGVANIILTTRYLPGEFKNRYIVAKICDLSDDDIRSYLNCPNLSIEPNSILRYPLYLRLYKRLNRDHEMHFNSSEPQTKCEILEEVFISHPTDIFGEILSDDLRTAYAYFLPFLCFQLVNKRTLRMSYDDLIDSMAQCIDSIDYISRSKIITRMYIKKSFLGDDLSVDSLLKFKDGFEFEKLIPLITGQLFPQIGNGDGDYEICHQDIRDFFAAHYIKCSIALMHKVNISQDFTLWENTLEEFDKNKFDVDAVFIIFQTLQNLDYPLNNVRDRRTLYESLLRLLCFYANKVIESAHNGSELKRKYCEALKGVLDSVTEYLLEERTSLVDFHEIVVLDAEIHRRLGEYDLSNEISSQLLSRAVNSNDTMKRKVNNNIAKCTLYHAFDVAHAAETGYSGDAEKLYREAIQGLNNNADFPLSANLYAMLMANPDPISARYLQKIMGEDMAERRFKAYNVELNAYNKNDSIYALQTLLSYLLHGNVKVSNVPGTEQGQIEKTPSEHGWDIRENKDTVFKISQDWIQKLTVKSTPAIVSCFRGLIQLYEDRFDDAMLQFEQSFFVNHADKLIEKSCLGCFVYATVNGKLLPEDRIPLLNLVWKTIDRKKTEHSVDSFDFSYVLIDIETAWKGLQVKYSDMISQMIRENIESNLRELKKEYLEEYRKWNM